MNLLDTLRQSVLSNYGELFSYIDGRLYFCDTLKFIHDGEVEIEYEHDSYLNIVPFGHLSNGHVYIFRLFLSNGNINYQREREIYITGGIKGVIPDAVCLLLYKYDIDIYHNLNDDGVYKLYNRVEIMRPHIIKEILK